MMVLKKRLPRRTFLRGVGTALALPLLDAMTPAFAAPAQLPIRCVFVYVPNGINMAEWTPREEGREFALPSILAPLESHRQQLLMISGLAQNGGRPLGDGAGDHARAAASFLTGAHPLKTAGNGLRNGISADQVAASHFGGVTPFASLELGCEAGGSAGECDSGYSCAYSNNLAWRTPSSPLPPESNPRMLFERLFSGFDASGDSSARAHRAQVDRSILDFALDDARRLAGTLGAADRLRLDEYLFAVRDIERRIALAAEKTRDLPAFDKPMGVPDDFGQHARLLFDLLAVAFRADLTRVATFMMATEGSGRPYPEIGIAEAHHPLTHHDNRPELLAKIARINTYHLEQFAYFLGRLQAIPEGGGNLLNQAVALYGSGISDGNSHDHGNLPILLAGGGGGRVKGGRHWQLGRELPMANLLSGILGVLGVESVAVGDSTGALNLS
jgi:hypothetical protein